MLDNTTSNTVSNDVLVNNYQVVGLSSKLSKKNVMNNLDAGVILDIFTNTEATDNNDAYLVGGIIGDLANDESSGTITVENCNSTGAISGMVRRRLARRESHRSERDGVGDSGRRCGSQYSNGVVKRGR